MARGVGIIACGAAQIEVSEIAARAAKKAVVGTGTASKKQIQDMVARLLQVRAFNADAADALAIAIAASNDASTEGWRDRLTIRVVRLPRLYLKI